MARRGKLTCSPAIYMQRSLTSVNLMLTKRLRVENFLVWMCVMALAISSRSPLFRGIQCSTSYSGIFRRRCGMVSGGDESN